MITGKKITKTINVLKTKIGKYLLKNRINDALKLISISSNILYFFNQLYTDDDLEEYIENVAKSISTETFDITNEKTIIFYDGFGFCNRGLIIQYLRALTKFDNFVYITFRKFEKSIKPLEEIILSNSGKIVYLEKSLPIDQIKELNEIIYQLKPKHFFIYTTPFDVIVTTSLTCHKTSNMKKYLINLTDHAYWLGTRIFDILIEFREYGAFISEKYRKIDKSKLVKLPFYPIIDNKEFEGYPFNFDEKTQKLIFSGGALYKTIDKENTYYKIIEKILNYDESTVFWYAGSGNDKKMKLLMKKYPNRVFLTKERPDFLEIIKRSYFYLNTYPISGGLMPQYAASVGKVPLSLKHNDDITGILIEQEKLNIIFDSLEELFSKIELLLSNENEVKEYSTKLKNAVISEEKFNNEIKNLLEKENTNYKLNLNKTFDDEKLRQTYLNQITYKEFCDILITKETIFMLLMIFPKESLFKIFSKIKNKFFCKYRRIK